MSEKVVERVHVTLAPNVAEMLSRLAREKGVSRSAMIAFAIEKFFKNEKGAVNE